MDWNNNDQMMIEFFNMKNEENYINLKKEYKKLKEEYKNLEEKCNRLEEENKLIPEDLKLISKNIACVVNVVHFVRQPESLAVEKAKDSFCKIIHDNLIVEKISSEIMKHNYDLIRDSYFVSIPKTPINFKKG